MRLSADILARWRADIVTFATEALHLRNPETSALGPLVLQAHQERWLREATRRDPATGRFMYRVAVASWPKREGKTCAVGVLLTWRIACFEDQRAGVIANSERQAQSNVFDAVLSYFRDSPTLRAFGPEVQTSRLAVPLLNSELRCFPANWATIQGTRFDVLACDELHASDDGGRAYVYASQQTETANAQTLISSQAGAPVQANPMWRLYQAAQDGARHIYFDYRQECVTPWAIARAEAARVELLPGEWDYLWRNAWGATGIRLFTGPNVEAAARGYAEPTTPDEWRDLLDAWGWRREAVRVGVGLDRAGVSPRGDRTVWSVVAQHEGHFHVVRCAVLPTGSESEVLAEWERTKRVFGAPDAIIFESYGCGDLVGRVPGAQLMPPTLQRQQALFTRLHRAMTEGRLWFPADAGEDPQTGAPGVLKAELLAFSYDAQREGMTRFGTQRGAHDDTVYSVAWAAEAATLQEDDGPVPFWADPDYVRELEQDAEQNTTDTRAATGGLWPGPPTC